MRMQIFLRHNWLLQVSTYLWFWRRPNADFVVKQESVRDFGILHSSEMLPIYTALISQKYEYLKSKFVANGS